MKKPTNAPAVPAAPLAPELKAKINEWLSITGWMAKAKARETELRKELVAVFVPNPKEGTNHVQGLGFAVTIDHKVSRKLDEAALDAVMPQMPEHLRVVGTLISYEPTFDLKVYRAMTPDERKIFDQALVIKDGAPSLEITIAEDAAAGAGTSVVAETSPASNENKAPGVDFKKLAERNRQRCQTKQVSKPALKPARGGKRR